tara:strand:+ start:1634 stop:2032 length:399 start_codon:yes stop_codon:yes gene_type:complete
MRYSPINKHNYQQIEFFLYDNECGLCREGVEFLERFQYDSDIKFIPCEEYNIEFRDNLNCKRSSYFIISDDNGKRVYPGASGVNRLFRGVTNNRFLKYFGYLYLLPPLNIVQDIFYYIVKKNRKRIRTLYKT